MRRLTSFLIVLLTFSSINAQNQQTVTVQGNTVSQLADATLFYGYRIAPSTSKGFISFSLNTPTAVTSLSTVTDGSNTFSAGEFVNGDIYLISYSGGANGTIKYPEHLVCVSSDTWNVVSTAPIQELVSDMAYDYSANTMYGLALSGTTSALYAINLSTGNQTLLTLLSQRLVGIAVHTNGTMYGISVTGKLYTINKTTYGLTLVGDTGISPLVGTNDYLAQSIGFDHYTGKLYWAYISNSLVNSGLYEVNTSTGLATPKGLIDSGSEVIALTMPYYSYSNIPAAPANFTVTPDLGSVSATLHWTNPSLARSGNALTQLSSLVIERNGVVVHTINNPIIGGAASWTDNTISQLGDYIYTIYGVTEGYQGVKSSQSVFIGADPCEVTTFPLTEGFEASGDPACWTSIWTTVSNQPLPSNVTAHSGNRSWRFSSYNGSNNWNQYLISPRLAVTATPKTLQFFYNTLDYDMEHFRVGYSITDNDPSNFIWVNTFEYIATNGWAEYSRIFPPETKFIAIHYFSNFRFYLYIDDITINEIGTTDVAVTEIQSPHSGSNLTANETVTVVVRNNGSQPVSNIPVKFAVDGVVVGNEVVSGSLAGQTSRTHTFTTKADLHQQKSYQLKAYTALGGDEHLENDTSTLKVTNFGNCIFSFPFTERFEDISDLACWDIRYNDNRDKPGLAQIAHTGATSWAFASANSSSDQLLITPELQSGSKPVSLRFYYNNPHHVSETIETFQVGYSTTDKQTSSFNWGTGISVAFTNGWKEFSANFPAGVKYICIHYYANHQNHLYIDDLTVREVSEKDVAVTAITAPVSGTDLSPTETVTVQVKNTGTTAVSGIPVVYELDGVVKATETITGSIAPSATVSHTFAVKANLSAVKTYTIKAYTAWTEDEGLDNDTLSVQVENTGICAVSTFPLEQGFEEPIGVCWKTYNLDGDFNEWERMKSEAHSGEYSLSHASGPSEQDDWLISPKMVIPANRIFALYFWSGSGGDVRVDYRKYSVLISTGSNVPGSSDFVQIWSPTSIVNNWEEVDMSLAAYAGKEVYIAFRYQGRLGTSWYLDDIAVRDITDVIDAGVTKITSPVLNAGDMGNETVKVKVKNFGGQTLTNLPVKFQVNGQEIASEIVNVAIAPLQTIDYTYTTPAPLSEVRTHTIRAYTALAGDIKAGNDAASVTVTNYGACEVSSFPYSEDFELEPDRFICWKVYDVDGNTNATWRPASKLGGSTIPAYNGSQVALHSDYLSFQDGWLVSPKINVPADGVYEFSFQTFTAYSDWYGGDAESSVWISTTGADPVSGNYVKVWSPDKVDESWSKVRINLYDYIGQPIYVAFHYKGTDAHAWFVDDVEIKQLNGEDAGVTKILSPKVADAGNPSTAVKVEIKNFGSVALTAIPVAYKLNGGTAVEAVYQGTLLPGHTIDYTFNQTIDLSGYGEYILEAYTKWNGDIDPSNNGVTSGKIINRENITLHGYRLRFDEMTDISQSGFVSFKSNSPSEVTTVNFYRDGNSRIDAGEYIDGTIYAYSENKNFIRLTSEWVEISKVSVPKTPSDMTYDRTTNTLFAITGAGNHSDLQTVDMTTGLMTTVGSTDRFIYTLAADNEGKLYGLEYDGGLCSINKQTGVIERIVQTGFLVESAMQSMTFDARTGRLFWAAVVGGHYGRLIEINPVNGVSVDLGDLGHNSQITALYSSTSGLGVSTINAEPIALYPNPSNGVVHLSSLPEHSTIRIIDLLGKTVYTNSEQSGDVTLHLKLKTGAYSVIIENKGMKNIHKLIIH